MVCLLPIITGLLLRNDLPGQIPAHFDFNGNVDSYSEKAEIVFFLPLLLLAEHMMMVVLACLQKSEGKIWRLLLWLLPTISVCTSAVIYANALGYPVNIVLFVEVLFGSLIIMTGNYFPKCRQNYIIGIRTPWTLKDEENWHSTHRIAGKMWVMGGIIILIAALALPSDLWALLLDMAILFVFPVIYSFSFHLKKKYQHL